MTGSPGSKIGLVSTRPTVYIDGEVHTGLTSDLLELVVEETIDGDHHSEAVFNNWSAVEGEGEFVYLDRQSLDFGKHFAVEIGGKGAGVEIFSGRITALEARYPDSRPPVIVTLAEDRLQDLRRTRRTRVFEEITDSDLIARIAGEHGLAAEVEIDGPVHPVLAQVNRSDLDFLRSRVRSIDAELWVERDTLLAQSRSRRHAGHITMAHGGKLKKFSVLADLADQCTTLTVSGWDANTKETIAFEAGEAAIRAELGGAQGGSSVLDGALGPRVESVVDLAPHSLEEARSLAEAAYRGRARRFLTGRGVCENSPGLRVGTRLTLEGLGELFDGEYYTTQVRHSFTNEGGFLTVFSVERPGLGKE